MKTNTFIASIVLATASLALAQDGTPETNIKPADPIQTKPVTPSSTAGTGGAKDRNFNPDGSLMLSSNPLGAMVREIEAHVPYWPQKDGVQYTMPNVIFAPGTAEMQVTADIVFREVTPVQALTLLASAAGCTLEPVVAVQEDGGKSDSAVPIIGYRFVLSKRAPAGAGMAGMAGMGGMGGEMAAGGSGFPGGGLGSAGRATMSMIPHTAGSLPAGSSGGLPGKFVPGAPEAISLGAPEGASGIMFLDDLRAREKAATTRLVRVYGLGAALGGDARQRKEKEGDCATLIMEAISLADLNSKPQPELSFHSGSGALIVKATVAQHEIIEQAVKALKENETSRPDPLPVQAPVFTPIPSATEPPATPKETSR